MRRTTTYPAATAGLNDQDQRPFDSNLPDQAAISDSEETPADAAAAPAPQTEPAASVAAMAASVHVAQQSHDVTDTAAIAEASDTTTQQHVKTEPVPDHPSRPATDGAEGGEAADAALPAGDQCLQQNGASRDLQTVDVSATFAKEFTEQPAAHPAAGNVTEVALAPPAAPVECSAQLPAEEGSSDAEVQLPAAGDGHGQFRMLPAALTLLPSSRAGESQQPSAVEWTPQHTSPSRMHPCRPPRRCLIRCD